MGDETLLNRRFIDDSPEQKVYRSKSKTEKEKDEAHVCSPRDRPPLGRKVEG